MRKFALCALLLAWMPTTALATQPPRLLVLDFELVDTSSEPINRSAEHARRLVTIHDDIASELAASKLYEIADGKALRAKIDSILQGQYLRSCNGCEFALAREAGADFVMLGQFNKISTLVGTMELLIKDARTQAAVYHQLFGFRGDTDEAWMRAARFFVESFKRKQNSESRGSQP